MRTAIINRQHHDHSNGKNQMTDTIKKEVLETFYTSPIQNSLQEIQQKLNNKYPMHLISRAFWRLHSEGKVELNKTKLKFIGNYDD